jgi:hypothetical protein
LLVEQKCIYESLIVISLQLRLLNKFTLVIMMMIILALSTFSSTTLFISADSMNPGVFSKDSAPYGIPYGEWLAKWWQWSFSIPAAQHPRDAYTPEKCALNQKSPVWFLADQLGGQEERTCTIPAGKAIFVPLLVGECDYSSPDVKTDEALRRCAKAGDEYGVIEATVDGVKIKNLEQYRAQSGFFNLTIADDNIYGQPAGTYRAFTDGFFVFLEPLPPGRHDVHLKVSVLNPAKPIYNYNADWIYHLIVK